MRKRGKKKKKKLIARTHYGSVEHLMKVTRAVSSKQWAVVCEQLGRSVEKKCPFFVLTVVSGQKCRRISSYT